MKNKFLLIIAVVMSICLCFVLASCGETEDNDSDTSSSQTTGTESFADKNDGNDSSSNGSNDTEGGSGIEEEGGSGNEGGDDNGIEEEGGSENEDGDNGNAHIHIYGEWIVTKAPSCTAYGEKEKKCECGQDTIIEVVVATGHTNGEAITENRVEAECGTNGSYDLVIYCIVCSDEVSREAKVIEAEPHINSEAVVENEVEADCENDGSYDLVIYCTVCEKEVSRENKATPKTGHTSGEDIIENEEAARCDREGSYDIVKYCQTCGDEVSRSKVTVEKESHTIAIPVVENDNRVSCDIASSYESVVYCNICRTELSREKVEVPAKEHTNDDSVMENVKEASCTEDGACQVVVYCKDCKKELSREDQVISASHKYDGGVCTVCNAVQVYSRDGDKIYFGSYPQTRITDSSFISKNLSSFISGTPSVDNPRGWTSYGYYANGVVSDYMWYMDVEVNGERYRAVYFSAYRPEYCTYPSSNANSRQDDNYYYQKSIYWFKYEPVSWTIVKEENGYAYLLCDLILDAQQFSYNGEQSNNYEESTVRAWLNSVFYETTFSELEKAIIQITLVDNSVESTGYKSNSYACNDTEDKVYLMSYLEGNTYFDKYDERLDKVATDYAQCQGAVGTTFLLRSPDKSVNKVRLGNAGFYSSALSSITCWGIAPMIQIKL